MILLCGLLSRRLGKLHKPPPRLWTGTSTTALTITITNTVTHAVTTIDLDQPRG